MTHIIGWKNSKSIFISGDSAISSISEKEDIPDTDLKNKKSTFGETHIKEKKKIVQEKNLKLYNIQDELILGFAGSAATAFDVIDLIKRDFNKEENYEKIIKRALWCFRLPKNIRLIIGFYENKTPILMSYNHGGNKEFVRHENNVTIGSLDEFHTMASIDFSNFVIEHENELTDDESILMVNSAHQGMIILSNLIRMGVGGFFTGFYINQNGVTWQKDTSYITFDINPEFFFSEEQNPNLIYIDPAVINMLIRENRVAIASPYPDIGQQRNFYKNYLRRTASVDERSKDKSNDLEWYKKWGKETNEIFNNAESDYYCFFCKCPNIPLRLTFVSKESNEKENWFSIEKINENRKYIITPHGNFINEFKPRESEIPINFHWCREQEKE